MALKEYSWNGRTWQFEEADAPEGAIPVAKAAKAPANKAAKAPVNKARATRTKKTE